MYSTNELVSEAQWRETWGTLMDEQTFFVVASKPQKPKARGPSQIGVWSRRVAEGMGA
jgi:hypothetical protein